MHVQFWGAARAVTGSMHLVEVAGRRFLLDCGLYQGRRKEAFERNRRPPFEPHLIDAVILSHAHIDHCGNLPTLVRAGFPGRINATPATRDLCEPMLLDSAHLQERDVEFVNRRRVREGGRPFEPLPGVRARFLDAGHILGSAAVVLDLEESGRRVRLAFSGDIGRRGLPILRDPRVPEGAHELIMESTYGDRLHPPADEARARLRECARAAYESGGKLLIPAFALGRAQEVVHALDGLWRAGDLPPMDVFVDSPLAADVTEVFRSHPECFDQEMRATLRADADGDPFGFGRLAYVRSAESSKALNELEGPAIVVSPSGMCEGGRILHHLRHRIGDPRTIVLFVGYQAEHTLGRRLLDGNRFVSILGERHEVRARIERADAYSAHADRRELLEWAERAGGTRSLRRIFLVHGEEPAYVALAEALRARGGPEVTVPERGERFPL